MSGPLLTVIELSLVFLVVFGWGFHELRSYRQYKREQSRRAQMRRSSDEPISQTESAQEPAEPISKSLR